MQRDLTRLALIQDQIKAIEQARLARLEQAPQTGPNAMIRMLASIRGLGIETAEMLVQEVLSRNLRDRRAVGRYAGLTGAPDESGSKRREKGLAKSGPGAPLPDPARLALPVVPEGQRSGAVVPEPDRGRQRGAQDQDDRRSWPQAAHRALAHGHHR
jgi:transposase